MRSSGSQCEMKTPANVTRTQCGVAQNAGVRHGVAVVGKADGAGFRQRRKVARLAALRARRVIAPIG